MSFIEEVKLQLGIENKKLSFLFYFPSSLSLRDSDRWLSLRSVCINFNFVEDKLHLGIENKKLSFLFCSPLGLY